VATEILRDDYDLNLRRVYNPRAPIEPTDIVRLQDLTGYAEVPLTFQDGVTRTGNVIRGDYITGIAVGGGGSTVWTGGTGAGEGVTLRTTAHATKGVFRVGSLSYNEQTKQLALYSNTMDDYQLSIGESAGNDYRIGRGAVSGTLIFYGQQLGVDSYEFSGAGGVKLQLASGGGVTMPSLAGVGSTLVKTSSAGLLSRATSGTDYEVPLTFGSGVTRTVNAVTGDYITGVALAGGNTTWTGGTGSGEGIIIRTTSHATKGTFRVGSLAYNEQTKQLVLYSNTLDDYQLSIGETAGNDYRIGRGAVSGALTFYGQQTGVDSYVFTGVGGVKLQLASGGGVTMPNLGGAGSALVKASSAGLLSRATTGVDFEVPLTFADGVTRTSNTVRGDYITGVAVGGSGNTTWTGGTGTGEGVTIRTTSHATKGRFTVGTLTFNEATSVLSVLNGTANVQVQIGENNSNSFEIGRNGTSGLLVFHGKQAGVDGYVFTGVGGEKMRIAANGEATIPNLGGGSAAIVKASTAGLLQRATAGTDFEAVLTFTSGVTRSVNTVTGDYITGIAGSTTWSGSNNGGGLTIRANTGGTGILALSAATLQTPTIQANSGDGANSVIILDGAAAPVFRGVISTSWADSTTTNFAQLGNSSQPTAITARLGSQFGRLQITSSVTQITAGTHSSTPVPAGGTLFEVLNASHVMQFRLTTSDVTVNSLAGTGSAVIKASSTGVLSRATAGTDFEAILTFNNGLTRSGNTVSGDYITGVSGNTTWTGSTTSGGQLTIRSSSHATKGYVYLNALQVFVPPGNTTTTPGIEFDTSVGAGFSYSNAGGIDIVRVIANQTTGAWFTSAGMFLNNGGTIDFGQGSTLRGLASPAIFEVIGTSNAAQTLRVYNSFLSPTNFEAARIDWSDLANVLTFGTQAGSGGGVQHRMRTMAAAHGFNVDPNNISAETYFAAQPNGNGRDKVRFQVGGTTVTGDGFQYQFFVAPVGTTFTSTAQPTDVAAMFIDTLSVTVNSGASITNLSTLHLLAPSAAGAGTVSNRYVLFCESGLARFNGDGTHVWQVPTVFLDAYTPTSQFIPIKTAAGTRYLQVVEGFIG
jgi:hypothetical protein